MIPASLLQRAVDMVASLPDRQPHRSAPKRLVSLFARLQAEAADPTSFEIEDLIWAVWTDDVPEPLAEPMQAAIRAMASRQLDEAEIILDGLLTAAPDWAEAWNKRATLAYIRGDDIEAVADILATLALEPRHFGALSGLGQICLRQGEPEVAKLAFEAALRINPRLDGIADVLGELASPRRSLN